MNRQYRWCYGNCDTTFINSRNTPSKNDRGETCSIFRAPVKKFRAKVERTQSRLFIRSYRQRKGCVSTEWTQSEHNFERHFNRMTETPQFFEHKLNGISKKSGNTIFQFFARSSQQRVVAPTPDGPISNRNHKKHLTRDKEHLRFCKSKSNEIKQKELTSDHPGFLPEAPGSE